MDAERFGQREVNMLRVSPDKELAYGYFALKMRA
jgi:hypothetical protein